MVNALIVLLWVSLGMVTRDGCAARIAVADVRAAMANVARSVRRIASSSLVYGSSVLLPAGAPARTTSLSSSATYVRAPIFLPPMGDDAHRAQKPGGAPPGQQQHPTSPSSPARKPYDAPAPGRAGRGGSSSNFVREAVKVVGPSVVRVDCEREVSPFMSMFSDQYRDGDTIKVSGSGIVVTHDGYLLTNSHVIQGARSLTVTLSSGRTFKAVVVAFDELTDLAVLKADVGLSSLPTAPMGDSSKLASGDWVIAVGCPVGLDFTVTLGIVSSPKRSAFEVGAVNLKGTYIQTDAALNSGNSGGPLVNDVGEVIGINTMVRTNTEAIGFAIPINRAKQIYDILKQGRKPSHAYFGIEVTSLTPDGARIHNDDPNAQRLPEVHGALVVRVVPGSPAAQCGFRKNDIIVEVNGDDVGNSEDADVLLDRCRPGGVTRLKVLRGEPASAVELHATPLDLLTVMEQRRGQAGPGGGGGGGGNGAPPQKPGPPAAQGKGNEGPYPETYY